MSLLGSALVQKIDGESYSTYFDADKIREALEFKPRQGDIILMTHPSSGTHWVNQMIQLILHEGRSARTHEEFYSRFTFLEHSGKKADEVTSTPRLIVTHIRPGKIAVSSEAKYVYMARAPWDVCTSLYDGWGVLAGAETPSFGDFLSLFLSEKSGTGSYFKHLHAGYTRRNLNNFFFVTYEEASRDSKGVFLRLADFLVPECARTLADDPALLSKVAGKSDAAFMRGILNVSKERMTELVHKNANLDTDSTKSTEGSGEHSLKLVRHATTGRWAQTFSKEQLRLMLKKIADAPEGQCVKNIWKEEFIKVSEAAHQ